MSTNLLRGRSDLNPVFLASVEWARELETNRLTDYAELQSYYDGSQNVNIPEKVRVILENYLGFRANFSDVVVDALAERLHITGFSSEDKALADRAWHIWQRNNLDEGSAVVTKQTLTKADGFVLVDFDNERNLPRIRFQSPETIKVEYEDSSNTVISRAAKTWSFFAAHEGKLQQFTRMTIYYPDKIEKYITKGDGQGSKFQQYQEEGEAWPLPWTHEGQPIGVPLFHFRNLWDGDTYGHSEITNVIPLQDALNKAVVDLMVVADTMGFPQRYIFGAKAPAGGWNAGPGITWHSDNPKATAGAFEQADLSQLIALTSLLINLVAGRSRTPQHLFSISGEYPSGEALKTAEAGLVSKAENRSISFGNVWEDALLYALKLDNIFADGMTHNLEEAYLTAQWRDFETRNELLHTQAVILKQPIIGDRQALREMDYSEQQITLILKEREEDRAKEAERNASLGSTLLDSFMQNQSPDLNPAQNVGADQGTNAGEPNTDQPPRFAPGSRQ